MVMSTAALAFLVGAQQSAPPVRQAWEYRDCANSGIGKDNTDKDLGADGWELVAVTPPTANDLRYHFYYKRPK